MSASATTQADASIESSTDSMPALTVETISLRASLAEVVLEMASAIPATLGPDAGPVVRRRLMERAAAIMCGRWDTRPEMALVWKVPQELLHAIGLTPPVVAQSQVAGPPATCHQHPRPARCDSSSRNQ